MIERPAECTRWFKYDRDYLCVNKSQFVPVIFEPPCKIRPVYFLNARNVKLAVIHRHICEVYGENATSDGLVTKWVRMLNEGRDNVHDEPRSGRPVVFTGGHILRGGH